MALLTELIGLAILLLLSGFFSGSEVALVSLTKVRARHMFDKKKPGSSFIVKLKEDPQRMLATILIGNNVVNVGASAMMTAIFLRLFDNYAVAIATGIMTLLILVFGEITPKSIAAKNSELISQLVAGPIWYLSIFLAPILNILDALMNKIIKTLGIQTKEKAITEEEIISIIKTAEEEGSIKEIEKKMINNIFEFDDIDVSEIKTPRTDMVMIDSNSNVEKAINLILKKNVSRIPVYEKHKDNIIGIVYVKDLISLLDKKGKKTWIKTLIKKPYVVPETKKISSLLRQFQKRKEHMAIVVDEHGSITGLVTLEDVLEEIVGEIMDESDKVTPNIQKLDDGTWMVQGKTEIEEINEKLKMKIDGKDYDTFGGFILKHAGKVPKENDKLEYFNFDLKIEEMDGHRITAVKVEKK